jgi:hypothetical protein
MNDDYEADVNYAIREGFIILAGTILPHGLLPGRDKAGGTVDYLTEAVMGITAGLVKVADAISELAEAVRENN